MAEEIIGLISRSAAKEQGQAHYFTGKPCKHGHFFARSVATGHCLMCERLRYAEKQSSPEYRQKRSDAARRRRAKPGYIEAEKERYMSPEVQSRVRAYRRRDDVKERRRKYARSEKGKKALAERERRFRSTPYGAAKDAARRMIRRSLERAGREKSDRAHMVLGYSPDDLARHLESLFRPGMSWKNRRRWHIDHIRPLSSFDLTTEEGIREANSLHNLRPVWAKKNLKKSDQWNGALTLPL